MRNNKNDDPQDPLKYLIGKHACAISRTFAEVGCSEVVCVEMLLESFTRFDRTFKRLKAEGKSVKNPDAMLFRHSKAVLRDQLAASRFMKEELARQEGLVRADWKIDKEQLKRFLAVLDSMSSRTKYVVFLYTLGQKQEDIAKKLGISQATVSRYLQRARIEIIDCLFGPIAD